jgi:hypothetical protein
VVMENNSLHNPARRVAGELQEIRR